MSTADPPSGWHSIRPWNARLSLCIREITSVSVTFILAVEPTRESDVEPSLAALGFTNAENDHTGNDGQGNNAANDEPSTSTKPRSLITEKLANGLRVNVNEANWQRVFIRADEKVDEAIIIIYGLMPGRQYDIDLAVVQPGQQQQHLRRQVLTFDENGDLDSTSENSTDPDSYDHSNASSDVHQAASTPSTSPSRTIPSTPPPGNSTMLSSSSSDSGSSPPRVTLEEHLSQLHHSLSLINAERENLFVSLKSARKESQKADAALRSEMEALKRASEKHSAGEVRARQKILALQEAVRRAQTATKETALLGESTESEVPELLKQKQVKEAEYAKIKQEADKVHKSREMLVEKDKKRQESMRSELQSLTHKLEKLTAKKEKHETATIPDLEEQLSTVEKDIEEQEKLLMQMEMNREFEDVNRLVLASVGQQQQYQHQQAPVGTPLNPFNVSQDHYFREHSAYVPNQRTRHSSLGTTQPTKGPGTIGRPNQVPFVVTPVQRPNFSSSSSASTFSAPLDPRLGPGAVSTSTSQNIWSAPQLGHTPNTSNVAIGRSSSLHYHPSQYRDASFYRDASQPQLPSSVSSTSYQQQQRHDVLPPIATPTMFTSPSRRGSLKSSSFGNVAASPISSNSSSSHTPAPNPSLVPTPPSSERRSSLSSASPPTLQNAIFPSLQSSKGTSGTSSSLATGNPPISISSTLSGRAPVFEPGKGRGTMGNGTSRAPGGGTVRGPGVIGAGRRS